MTFSTMVPAPLWAKAIAIIDAKLLISLSRRAESLLWLEQLGQQDDDGERLVLCLAVDLAYDAYRSEAFAHLKVLFDSIDYAASDPRFEFASRLEAFANRRDLNCASRFVAASEDHKSRYAVVMRLQRCIDCFGATALLQDTEEDRARFLRRVARRPKIRLSGAESWWTQKSGVVWVFSAQDLAATLEAVPESGRATKAKNMLGIAHPAHLKSEVPVQYMLVEYPEDFAQPCHQPTALDAWWRANGHYYLSWRKEDNWGRTQNCTGDSAITDEPRNRSLERVHHCYQGPIGEFTVKYLGVYPGDAAFVDELAKGRQALRLEAYNRLKDAPDP